MSSVASSSRTVLIVDDDAEIRQALTGLLATAGYEALEAGDGKAALDLLRGGAAPDLVVLDLMMPTMDGWQFFREQRRTKAGAEVPVLICSGAGESELEAQALGAAAWLNKPVEAEELLTLIRQLLN